MLSIFLDIKAEINSIEQETSVLKKKAILLQKTNDINSFMERIELEIQPPNSEAYNRP